MSGNIWEYLASFIFIYTALDFCLWFGKMCMPSPLLVFLFIKRSFLGFLLGVIIFLAIGYLVGWHLVGFSWWSGLVFGFIYWMIIGIVLSEKKKTAKLF